jgi:hypothetical protein
MWRYISEEGNINCVCCLPYVKNVPVLLKQFKETGRPRPTVRSTVRIPDTRMEAYKHINKQNMNKTAEEGILGS